VGDALKKVKPRDPLVIPATTFNTFVDAARDFLARMGGSLLREAVDDGRGHYTTCGGEGSAPDLHVSDTVPQPESA
jgi:hypothetical protein